MTLDTGKLREYFPITKTWNYLNHATHGPLPTTSITAVTELVQAWQSPPDLDHSENQRTVDSVRSMIAGRVKGNPGNVAFTGNLAESMSLAAGGIDWKPGDNCVIPEAEFPSVVYPFLNQSHRGVEVRFACKGDDGYTSVDRIREKCDQRTRAIVLSHVEFMTGYRNDLAALSQLCQELDGLLIVDVTQSLGPSIVDVEATGVDVIAAHSYKWLMASYGVGVTYLSDRAIERIRPTYAGRLSVDLGFEDLTYELDWRAGAERYQTGGLNWITLRGLEESLKLITSLDAREIERHTLSLTDRLLDGVASRGYEVRSCRRPEHRSAIVAFSSGDSDRDAAIIADLEQKRISLAQRGRGIRVSPYFYNTDDEVDALVEALPRMA